MLSNVRASPTVISFTIRTHISHIKFEIRISYGYHIGSFYTDMRAVRCFHAFVYIEVSGMPLEIFKGGHYHLILCAFCQIESRENDLLQILFEASTETLPY